MSGGVSGGVREGGAVEVTVVRVLLDSAVDLVRAVLEVLEGSLLELDGVPTAGHNRFTTFPIKTCPNTDAAGTLTPSQTSRILSWTLAMPFAHADEQVVPCLKSSVEQPGRMVL